MPNTPNLTLPYPVATDPADVPRDIKALADRLDLVTGGGVGAAPPASPVTGQLWILPVGNGVNWVFRYNAASASAYKWEFVGGARLMAEAMLGEAITSTAYQPLSGPSVVLPRAGEYDLSVGMNVYNLNATVATIYMSFKIGAAAADDNDGLAPYVAPGGGAGRGNYFRTTRKTVATAGTTIQVVYRSDLATGGQVFNRALIADPVRVG